ncbi:hypothetical protein DUNSADRAFT_915, partial [Dunaliella salina]
MPAPGRQSAVMASALLALALFSCCLSPALASGQDFSSSWDSDETSGLEEELMLGRLRSLIAGSEEDSSSDFSSLRKLMQGDDNSSRVRIEQEPSQEGNNSASEVLSQLKRLETGDDPTSGAKTQLQHLQKEDNSFDAGIFRTLLEGVCVCVCVC